MVPTISHVIIHFFGICNVSDRSSGSIPPTGSVTLQSYPTVFKPCILFNARSNPLELCKSRLKIKYLHNPPHQTNYEPSWRHKISEKDQRNLYGYCEDVLHSEGINVVPNFIEQLQIPFSHRRCLYQDN